ncbi:DUF4040 family protein [Agilicoccus flavus]|uniref:DUF4040 family protein n=1 Tax=Agilicoccus flavus TaxID=2775968 RepID=UPI001CF61918|nr:DUF4040 family protein [Agilicoccus flavus]
MLTTPAGAVPLTLALLVLAVVVSAPLVRVAGRNAGWPLAALYLLAAGAFTPAAADAVAGGHARWSMEWVPALGVELAFRVDGIGVLFTYIATLIGAVVFAYSTRYLKRDGANLSFYLVMTTFTAAMTALVLTDDLVVLFVCWELTSIASFLLIARSGRGAEAPSFQALLVTFVGGLAMLVAVGAIVARTGTTVLSEALRSDVWGADPSFATAVALLVIIAAFTKSAQFPFHVWLPAAMAADTPVSAYLHAAAVVKAGIFLLMRFGPAFADVAVWHVLLIGVGLLTNCLGAWFALAQTDLKKLMAYSTVSQLGLIVAAIGVGSPVGLTAAVVHTIAHALFKSGLFMLVGVVDHAAHTRDLRRLPQLYRAMPWTFAVALVGCASMAGLPPLLGFVSKESILTAMRDAPAGALALAVAAFGSVLTFSYCAKILLGGFVDGREEREIHPVEASLWWPTALPILLGVPLAFALGLLEPPVAAAVEAGLPAGAAGEHPHLSLWHGLTLELWVTALVVLAGVLVALRRARVFPALQRDWFGFDGARVVDLLTRALASAGRVVDRPVAVDHPSRHLVFILGSFAALLAGGAAVLASGGHLPAPQPGLSAPIDAVVLVLVTVGAGVVALSHNRIAATVSLSAVGVLVVIQIIALGAPDVALTQMLVEALTIVVIMLVLQKLPTTFPRSSRGSRARALGFAALVGVGAAAGTWALTGRRGTSGVAQHYIEDAPVISGGANIVNVILVEFRALDTLGELTVLGMAGIAIVALVSTVRNDHLDPPGDQEIPEIDLRADGSAAERAIRAAWANVLPLQLLLRVVNPILALVSAILFLRGHNEPGGGFIAALVGSAIVGLTYLSTSRDRQIGPPRLPVFLVGGGVITAVLTGLAGLVGATSFLEPLHGHIGAWHFSSSLVFDLGVYLAVLGLVMIAFNLLGTSAATRTAGEEGTRERADEAVEGELSGPLDTVRGESPGRVGRTTSFISSGTRPKEPGR